MARNKYSKLKIDISKVESWIRFWCEENLECEFSIDSNDIEKRIQYYVILSDGKIQIDFIKCAGGVYTISPNVGTKQELSKEIAEYIFGKVSGLQGSSYANGFSILMEKGDFDEFITFLKEDGTQILNSSHQAEPGKAEYFLYRLKGIAGDTVVVKYFVKTKRMQVQGKQLALFDEIILWVAESTDKPDAVVDSQIELCGVPLNRNDIYDEMKEILGEKIYHYLPASHRAILAFSFIQFKIDVSMPDYSGLLYPTYRAFEGFLKKLFTDNGLNCTGRLTLGEFFYPSDGSFYMKAEYSGKIETSMADFFTRMYGFYHQNRHPYAHASGDDFQTAVISNREIARSKFEEVIRKMKSCENYIQ